MGDSKPPSRERYERMNPTVSFRVARDIKAEFDEMVRALDTTKKAWFEGVIRDESERMDAVYEDGYADGKADGYDAGQADGYNVGYREGFEEGYELVVVEVPCAYCGEAVVVDSDEQKARLWDLIEILGNLDDFTAVPNAILGFDWWSHEACPK